MYLPYSSPASDVLTPTATSLRAIQIITVSLCTGVLVFMGIALAVNNGAFLAEPDFLSWFGFGFAALIIVMHLLVPDFIARNMFGSIDANNFRASSEETRFKRVATVYHYRHIITCALLEGAALLNLVMYFQTQFVGNVVTAAVLVLLMALRFPTAHRVQTWIQHRSREIDLL